MTSAATYNLPFKNIAVGIAGLALAFSSFFFAAVPHAHASTPALCSADAACAATQLTETQIEAILTLLSSFNVDPSTITRVNNILHNRATVTTSAAASIDTRSLQVTTDKSAALVTITGSASNVSSVTLSLKGYTGGSATVVNGRWSVLLGSGLPTGSYVLQLTNDADNTVLTTGTLTVSANARQSTTNTDTTSGTSDTSTTKTKTTTVPVAPLNSSSITVDSNQLTSGQSTTVRWSAPGMAYCSVYSGSTYISAGTSGTISTGALTATTVYSLHCYPDANQAWQYADVTVSVSSKRDTTSVTPAVTVPVVTPTPTDTTSTRTTKTPAENGGSSTPVPVAALNSSSITADSLYLAAGQSTTVRWSAPGMAYCSIYGGPSYEESTYITTGTTGSIATGALTQTTVYSIDCYPSADQSWQHAEVTVVVNTRKSSFNSGATDMMASLISAPYQILVDVMTDFFVAVGVR